MTKRFTLFMAGFLFCSPIALLAADKNQVPIPSNIQIQMRLLDRELKKYLEEADAQLTSEEKVLARVNQNDMCEIQKRGGAGISRQEVREMNEKLFKAVAVKIETFSLLRIPDVATGNVSDATLEKEVGGKTRNFKGWINISYKIPNENKTLTIRKHIFSIWNPRCYSEPSLNSRTEIVDTETGAD